MKININILGETVKTAAVEKNEGVRVVACELDNTICILFDGSMPICMADITALNELNTMYGYDTTDKTLKRYIDTLADFIQ